MTSVIGIIVNLMRWEVRKIYYKEKRRFASYMWFKKAYFVQIWKFLLLSSYKYILFAMLKAEKYIKN